MNPNDLMKLRYPHLAKVADDARHLSDVAKDVVSGAYKKMRKGVSRFGHKAMNTLGRVYNKVNDFASRSDEIVARLNAIRKANQLPFKDRMMETLINANKSVSDALIPLTTEDLLPDARAILGTLLGSGLGYTGGALARWIAPNAVSKKLPLYMALAGAPIGAVTPGIIDYLTTAYAIDQLRKGKHIPPQNLRVQDLIKKITRQEVPYSREEIISDSVGRTAGLIGESYGGGPLVHGLMAAGAALAGGGLGYTGGALARWLAPNAVPENLPLYMALAGANAGAPIGAGAPPPFSIVP